MFLNQYKHSQKKHKFRIPLVDLCSEELSPKAWKCINADLRLEVAAGGLLGKINCNGKCTLQDKKNIVYISLSYDTYKCLMYNIKDDVR